MDITQIVLTSSIFILTVILALVGFEVFLVFREVQKSLKKTNKVLEDFGTVSELITRQVTVVSGVFEALKVGAEFIKKFVSSSEGRSKVKEEFLLKEGGRESVADEDKTKTEINDTPEKKSISTFRRFFTSKGKKLS